MKSKFLTFAFFAALASFTFNACSDDDDAVAESDIAGSYTGKHTASMVAGNGNEYVLPENDAAVVSIVDNGDGTITVTTPEWALGTSEQAIIYTGYDLTVQLNDDGTFSQHFDNGIKSLSNRGNVIEFAAQFDGTVNEADKQMTYVLELNHASSHFVITFDGSK